MARALLTAILKTSFGQLSIDAEAGVIRGVKLMELGKLACFSGEDGKPKTVKITDKHISALLAHAGNRAIPIHKTHDWFSSQDKDNADTVEMDARIGAHKNIRRAENGDLISDAYFKAGQDRDNIMWAAEHNPEDNCFSVVFSYLKDDADCIPQNFRAGDLVPSGAATTALFSEDQTSNPSMDINELLTLLSDPKVKDALKAIIKSVEANEPDPSDETDATDMETEAGVLDADKKKDDDAKPALMRAQLRIARCITRKQKELAADKSAILAEVDLKVKAGETALLGRHPILQQGGEGAKKDEIETAIAEEIQGGAKNRQVALMAIARKKPAIYNAAVTAGKV